MRNRSGYSTGRAAAREQQHGFSLVELAIVILVMGLILGGLAVPLAKQRDAARVDSSREQIAAVRNALHGFALQNGFLALSGNAVE